MPADIGEQEERIELLDGFKRSDTIEFGGAEGPVRQTMQSSKWRRPWLWTLVLIPVMVLLFSFLPFKSQSPSTHPLLDSAQFTLNPSFEVMSIPTTREYYWEVSQVDAIVAVVGEVQKRKPMLVVNGLSPGPMIEANSNDRIIVHVKNALKEDTTSIHWHGLYQNTTNFYDGTEGVTQCGIPHGETMVYNFTLGGWSGTTWWHSHSGTQYTDGLFGPIVVHSAEEKEVLEYDAELVIHLSDIYYTWSPLLVYDYLTVTPAEPTAEPVPDAGAINGIGPGSYFNFTLVPNTTYRIRLINSASLSPIRFSIDEHTLLVVEADGTLVEPMEVDGVMVQVAQRYSVLVKTRAVAGTFWMRAQLDSTMFGYENPALNTEVLGVIRYSTGNDLPMTMPTPAPVDLAPSALRPLSRYYTAPPPLAEHLVHLTFSIQRSHISHAWRSYINHTSWEPLPSSQATAVLGLRQTQGDQLMNVWDDVVVVDYAIDNLDEADHPFHLHGYKPWIVGEGKGRYRGQALNVVDPMRRDTFLVQGYHYTVIRIVTDLPGYWAFHCHIAWHMAAGGMFQVVSIPSKMGEVPVDVRRHCAVAAG